ncbi:hypothetical protein HYDPIDRAFT_109124 [Hydnomerulius pinastri MD-312]|nr:hypothetical protein HYDPIDRAFT_109124 [Hydnomerulius pinastri MD-312]
MSLLSMLVSSLLSLLFNCHCLPLITGSVVRRSGHYVESMALNSLCHAVNFSKLLL